MPLELWISFIAASLVLCFSPGPTVLLVIGQSFSFGKKAVLPTVAGVVCGDIAALTFSLFGVGAILSASAAAFNLLKWCGVVYLIYLGIQTWRSPISPERQKITQPNKNKFKVFKQSLLVTALNPKGLIFFMAFLPLFINPQFNINTQMMILAITFLFISGLSVSFYTYFGSRVYNALSSAKTQKYFNRFSGGLLVSAGAVTASLKA